MQGVTVLMPRYLDYANKRAPTFSRYLVVKDRVLSDQFYTYGGQSNGPYWIDPTSPTVEGARLGLFFHSFTGGDGETLFMA
jgi:CRISPR-associated protein Cas5t